MWKTFECAACDELDREKFQKYVDEVKLVTGYQYKVFTGLYWINPDRYLPFDKKTREYLKKLNVIADENENISGNEYLELIEEVKSKMNSCVIREKTFAEISYHAYANS